MTAAFRKVVMSATEAPQSDPQRHASRSEKRGRTAVYRSPAPCRDPPIEPYQTGTAPRYNQYTKMNSPSHTTSTKCQYQAAASKAK